MYDPQRPLLEPYLSTIVIPKYRDNWFPYHSTQENFPATLEEVQQHTDCEVEERDGCYLVTVGIMSTHEDQLRSKSIYDKLESHFHYVQRQAHDIQ